MIAIIRWLSGKEPTCPCTRRRRCRFDPWVGKIPWRRKRQPIPVFLPGECHGQRSLVSHNPWGCRVRHDWAIEHTSLISVHNWGLSSWSGGYDFTFQGRDVGSIAGQGSSSMLGCQNSKTWNRSNIIRKNFNKKQTKKNGLHEKKNLWKTTQLDVLIKEKGKGKLGWPLNSKMMLL